MTASSVFFFINTIAAAAVGHAPDETGAEPDLLTSLIVTLLPWVLFAAFVIWIFSKIGVKKTKVVQDRALVQIDRSLEHMERVEQHLADHQRNLHRMIELLESIDRRLGRSDL